MGGQTTEHEETARGDRVQRRRDVLAAAAAALEDSGWRDFSIRDVAARAGVSGGAVYQWFSGKGEIWARLQTARFETDTATIEGWAAELAPGEAVHRLVRLIARNQSDLGRHRFEFIRGLEGTSPDYTVELAAAYAALNAAIAARVQTIYGDEDVPVNQAARLSWLWAVGKGVGDHMLDSRSTTSGVDDADFLDTTAECVLAGLRAPSPITVDRTHT